MGTEDSAAAVPGRETGREDAKTDLDPEAPAHEDADDQDTDPDQLAPRGR